MNKCISVVWSMPEADDLIFFDLGPFVRAGASHVQVLCSSGKRPQRKESKPHLSNTTRGRNKTRSHTPRLGSKRAKRNDRYHRPAERSSVYGQGRPLNEECVHIFQSMDETSHDRLGCCWWKADGGEETKWSIGLGRWTTSWRSSSEKESIQGKSARVSWGNVDVTAVSFSHRSPGFTRVHMCVCALARLANVPGSIGLL